MEKSPGNAAMHEPRLCWSVPGFTVMIYLAWTLAHHRLGEESWFHFFLVFIGYNLSSCQYHHTDISLFLGNHKWRKQRICWQNHGKSKNIVLYCLDLFYWFWMHRSTWHLTVTMTMVSSILTISSSSAIPWSVKRLLHLRYFFVPFDILNYL